MRIATILRAVFCAPRASKTFLTILLAAAAAVGLTAWAMTPAGQAAPQQAALLAGNLTGVQHLGIPVSDLKKSKAFYARLGFREVLMVQLPVTLLSTSIGVWLFYVQHQFEPTYWEHDERWAYEAAALEGSSYYELPKVLQWLTGNIGLHHIHHLNARIPNYRLQRVLESFPELRQVTTITTWQSFRCVSLALWDEQNRKLVRFRDAIRTRRQPA